MNNVFRPRVYGMSDPQYCTIRPINRSDLPWLLTIEQASFEHPWTENDFSLLLGRLENQGIGLLVELNQSPTSRKFGVKVILGHMVLAASPRSLEVATLATHPDYRRRGVATRLLKEARSIAESTGRKRVNMFIRERNLAAQLLAKSAGYRCVNIVSPDEDSDEPNYKFLLKINQSTI